MFCESGFVIFRGDFWSSHSWTKRPLYTGLHLSRGQNFVLESGGSIFILLSDGKIKLGGKILDFNSRILCLFLIFTLSNKTSIVSVRFYFQRDNFSKFSLAFLFYDRMMDVHWIALSTSARITGINQSVIYRFYLIIETYTYTWNKSFWSEKIDKISL